MLSALLLSCALLNVGWSAGHSPSCARQSDGTLFIWCGSFLETLPLGRISDTMSQHCPAAPEDIPVTVLSVQGCRMRGDELAGKLPRHLQELHLVNNVFLVGDGNGTLLAPAGELLELKLLNLTGNTGLRALETELLESMPALTYLVLDGNDLVALEPEAFRNNTRLRNLELTGNRWECQKMEAFVSWYRARQTKIQFHRQNETSCDYVEHQTVFGNTTFDLLIDNCPSNCSCQLVQTMIKVDCRNRGFYTIPQQVPHIIGILHMENNHIDSLQPLTNGTNYVNLRFLYVDNNSISSINALEGTDFFNGLNVLHISGNRLTQVPTHVLDRLLSTTYLEDVTLGRNPWNCECNTVAPFHSLLLKHAKRFKDSDQIRCASGGSYQPNRTITKLSMLEICASGYHVHPLDILNVCLVIAIVLVTAKILYDYRTYRLTGHLPLGPWQYWHSSEKRQSAPILEHRFNSAVPRV